MLMDGTVTHLNIVGDSTIVVVGMVDDSNEIRFVFSCRIIGGVFMLAARGDIILSITCFADESWFRGSLRHFIEV